MVLAAEAAAAATEEEAVQVAQVALVVEEMALSEEVMHRRNLDKLTPAEAEVELHAQGTLMATVQSP